MKTTLLLTMICSELFLTTTWGQLPYSWPTGANPGWTNSGALQWRNGCAVVATNCSGNYANNLNTSYTSYSIDASCIDATSINVTFTAYGQIEYGYDFLFIEYSLNNGTTWINPYGPGIGWTGNFGGAPGMTIPAITLPTAANIRFRFTFQSDWLYNYSGLKLTDFDVVCNIVLPVEMVSFQGKKSGSGNLLEWVTQTENRNDHFELEWTDSPEDGIWNFIGQVPSQGDSEEKQYYQLFHGNPTTGKNYYRIMQVDQDGNKRVHDQWAVVDNSRSQSEVVTVVNLMGQTVTATTPGVVIYVYEDGTRVKKYQ